MAAHVAGHFRKGDEQFLHLPGQVRRRGQGARLVVFLGAQLPGVARQGFQGLLQAAAKAQQALDAFAAAPEVFVTRVTPKKTRKKEIKQYLGGPLQAAIADGVLTLTLTTRILRDAGSVKPGEILAVLADEFGLPVAVSEADIHRTALTGRGRDLIDLVG